MNLKDFHPSIFDWGFPDIRAFASASSTYRRCLSQLVLFTFVWEVVVRKNKLVANAELQIPAGIRDLFDNSPLLASENSQIYSNLLSAIADDVKPEGVIEWLWLKDLVLQTWEIQRCWAFKKCIIERRREAHKHTNDTFLTILPESEQTARARRFISPSLNTETESARAFSESIDVLEKLTHQIASLERRRDNTLREIELRREILARRPKEASHKLVEVKESKHLPHLSRA